MNKGLIISYIAGRYSIEYNNQIYYGTVRGKLKNDIIPKVGDIAEFTIINDNNIIIEDIDERINDLIRPNICNIDQAFIIFSVKEPDLNLNLLDKFLVNLEYNNIKPIIIFNKWDLNDDDNILKIINYYKEIGYHTLITSTIEKDELIYKEIKELIKNKRSVLTGQRGVGKSSILNVLDPTLFLDTNEISIALGRGKHTTRTVSLLKINDGYVADTPGFGTIDFSEMDEVSIADNFVEFFNYKKECKYNGCLHLNEPDCMVKKKVEDGIILKSRYDNYLSFINDLRKDKKNDNRSLNPINKKRRFKK